MYLMLTVFPLTPGGGVACMIGRRISLSLEVLTLFERLS